MVDWVRHLTMVLLFGNDDPLFPKTQMINNKNRRFETSGLKRDHWSDASPIRKIFKNAFIHAELFYFNPHSFRNTLVTLGEKKCKSPEKFKARSQNLAHERVLTTFTSYGDVQPQRQAEIFQHFQKPRVRPDQNITADDIAEAVLRKINAN